MDFPEVIASSNSNSRQNSALVWSQTATFTFSGVFIHLSFCMFLDLTTFCQKCIYQKSFTRQWDKSSSEIRQWPDIIGTTLLRICSFYHGVFHSHFYLLVTEHGTVPSQKFPARSLPCFSCAFPLFLWFYFVSAVLFSLLCSSFPAYFFFQKLLSKSLLSFS